MVIRCLFFSLLIWLAPLSNAQSNTAEFDVIVNSNVAVNEISRDELKQILLANKTRWPDGKQVTIIYLSEDVNGADEISQSSMGMTSLQTKKHYLTKVFSGALASAPHSADSIKEALNLVTKTDGAVVLVSKGTKVENAKTLKVK